MPDDPNDKSRSIPARLKKWFEKLRSKGKGKIRARPAASQEETGEFTLQASSERRPDDTGTNSLTDITTETRMERRRKAGFVGASTAVLASLVEKIKNLEFDFKQIDLKNVSEYSPWIQKGLLVMGVFLAAELTTRVIGLWIRPSYPPLPKKVVAADFSSTPTEDYESILKRNIFNVEGKIPEAFDQGKLDCFAQAKPSQARITLLGTIVMTDDKFSVALLQDEGGANKKGVKKDETFFEDGKYQAMKVERKRFCFQVRATQDLEYIEIPEEGGPGPKEGQQLGGFGSASEGITAVSETDFQVKKNFLDSQLKNLDNILQTARAVPFVEPGTGKFKGFLVQSIESTSPFAALGVKTGDVISSVNGIAMDNPGKGLEAFQQLKNSTSIALKVLRGGQETTINYNLK